MIELYHNDMSVCAQKVRFTLARKSFHGKGIISISAPAISKNRSI